MKSYRKLIAAFFAALFVTAVAFAADASPAGTWKWTLPGRGDRPGFEQTLVLDVKDGQLTGTVKGGQGPMGEIPDVAISEASYKDGMVKFAVTREFGERKFTTKYEGKLDGDTIKGTAERAGRDGEMRKNDWTATRAK
jgi:hypothetical protein